MPRLLRDTVRECREVLHRPTPVQPVRRRLGVPARGVGVLGVAGGAPGVERPTTPGTAASGALGSTGPPPLPGRPGRTRGVALRVDGWGRYVSLPRHLHPCPMQSARDPFLLSQSAGLPPPSRRPGGGRDRSGTEADCASSTCRTPPTATGHRRPPCAPVPPGRSSRPPGRLPGPGVASHPVPVPTPLPLQRTCPWVTSAQDPVGPAGSDPTPQGSFLP